MSEDNKIESKKRMTDQERLALCQKMDKELDDFINSLERKRYTEGWPEDRWEEEMEKHPFFMKSTPENNELSPLAEGLAKLKYDPEENTPLELANNYKEDGNFNFKHHNYRLAIMGYTEGIKQKCNDADVNASLYNNRAAAHWHLKNYRSCLNDSEKALTFNPNHLKSRLRAAKAALEVSKYDLCIEHCQKLLETTKTPEIVKLLTIAKNKKLIHERDERRKERLNGKRKEEREAVITAIIQRGIKIANCEDDDDLDISMLEPSRTGEQDSIVRFEDGILKWPILLFYPEYMQTDFIKACPENVPLITQLEQVFPAPWDIGNKYNCNTVNIYSEGYDRLPHIIDPNKNLGDILVSQYFDVKAGTPAFCLLVRGSIEEKNFIQNYL